MTVADACSSTSVFLQNPQSQSGDCIVTMMSGHFENRKNLRDPNMPNISMFKTFVMMTCDFVLAQTSLASYNFLSSISFQRRMSFPGIDLPKAAAEDIFSGGYHLNVTS